MPNNEALYFSALKKIAKDYMSPDQLRRKAEKAYGLSYEEALKYAYENMQQEAINAIRGKRAPKEGSNAGK